VVGCRLSRKMVFSEMLSPLMVARWQADWRSYLEPKALEGNDEMNVRQAALTPRAATIKSIMTSAAGKEGIRSPLP